MADASLRDGGHEPDAASVRGLVIGAGVILVIVVVAIGVAIAIVRMGPHGAPAPASHATGSGLQPAPEVDIAAYRREKEALLHGYGWVDRAHGIARIPIEEAMALLAAGPPQGTKPR